MTRPPETNFDIENIALDPSVKGYAICGYPRSGSNYICQILASTGILGNPLDYFNGPGLRAKLLPAYPDDLEAQLRAILSLGRTPNGVYGLKILSAHFDQIAKCRWMERLPRLHFIHLDRRDILGQAISDLRAIQTGQYRFNQVATGTPRYDRRRIGRRLADIVRHQGRWRLYFARNGITPLSLVYEDIVRSPQGAAAAVARFIGLNEEPVVELSAVGVRVQRDGLSDEWRQRYLQESRNLHYLDRDVAGSFRVVLKAIKNILHDS